MAQITALPQSKENLRYQDNWDFSSTTANLNKRSISLTDFLPDSGASAHFTPFLHDLIDPENCHVPVTIADGKIVFATKVGRANIHFTTNEGAVATLSLTNLYYIPGLNRRLFSLPMFTRNAIHRVEINDGRTMLVFQDNKRYTWPLIAASPSTDQYVQRATIHQHLRLPTVPVAQASDTSSHINDDPIETPITDPSRPTKSLPLETAMIRFGFRNSRTILGGTVYNLWDDYQVRPAYDGFATSLRISVSRTHNLSRQPLDLPTTPFTMLFMDVVPTPHRRALTPTTAFPSSLLIVDAFSKYSMWIGLPTSDTATILEAIRHFLARTQALGRLHEIQYVRADAATYFTANQFMKWGRDNNINITIAAPHHQEMNGVCERHWQSIQELQRTLINHARLGNEFYHFAALYATAILNILSSKGALTKEGTPSCPYFLAFGRRPRIGNFRVFGCPASVKRYLPTTHEGLMSTPRTQIQQATRAIFIGFPVAQAGWLFYLPQPIGPHHFIVSQDAIFDEAFDSALACF